MGRGFPARLPPVLRSWHGLGSWLRALAYPTPCSMPFFAVIAAPRQRMTRRPRDPMPTRAGLVGPFARPEWVIAVGAVFFGDAGYSRQPRRPRRARATLAQARSPAPPAR
jgi:hypothetical protein